MCRWLGYLGEPIRPEELVYKPARSLIDQSRRHSAEVPLPNADGTGLGWYGTRDTPAVFRSSDPAWGDQNLRELAAELQTGAFLAHVRAGTGTPVQETNCHPFRYGSWLFVHNGYIGGFERLHRELLFEVAAELFGNIAGSTDSELMFHLALTFGLSEDPIRALERMAGLVEQRGRTAGIEHPLQMTIGLTDGRRLYAVRYASGPEVNSLFVSEDVAAIRALYPESERLAHFSEGARVVVSEPLAELSGLWREISPGSAITITLGSGEAPVEQDFVPQAPSGLSQH